MKKGEIWGPKGAESLSDLMVVEEVIKDRVYAYPKFGGHRGSMDKAVFERDYEHLDKTRVAELAKRYKPFNVVLDDFEDGFSIPAFTNGSSYSAGENPFFEKDAILKHIESGLLTDATTRVWFDDGLGTFVEVISQDFKEIPEDFDVGPLVERASAEGGHYDMQHPELGLLTTAIARKVEFEADGRSVVAYDVFNGWAWLKDDCDPTQQQDAAPTM